MDDPSQRNKPTGRIDATSGIDVTSDGPSVSPLARTTAASSLQGGAMLTERYRLLAPLGKGGMGEVWRADDLVLGSSVALKFLPGSLAMDPVRLDRFRAEVRLARQIAHPNVCRVYDITELPAEGLSPPRAFISMEFVDGEDLSSLLRRIGRLPTEKAVEVARQVCLGLAAAHEQGVIHRDLKPANVMLDGRGKVRLMDFGLASIGPVSGSESSAGTPLYMAPEQLAGLEATKRTDIYALGLVLYELFTGKPAHALGDRATIGDLRRLHESRSGPASMSTLIGDIDPLIERAVLRCLEKDPGERPGSAIAVAAALPGGDPLAAALAAGEMPSPEMIAQAGSVGSLRAVTAWATLIATVLLLLVCGIASAWTSQLRFTPLPLSTEVLTNKAAEIARSLGYTQVPADTAAGFTSARGYINTIAGTDSSPDRWKRLAEGSPPSVVFWYRESPVALAPTSIFQTGVSLAEPAPFFVGSISIQLDPKGRLLGFDAVPPTLFAAGTPFAPTDWTLCFAAAGFKITDFTPAKPTRSPWHASDERMAWEGKHPFDRTIPVRVEAAAEHGVVTSFRIMAPWSVNERTVVADTDLPSRLFRWLDNGVLAVCLLGGGAMAWRSIRTGRCDRRGAAKIAGVALCFGWLGAALSVEHLSSIFGLRTLTDMFAMALWLSGVAWVLYVALEPYVRQQWPTMLISWARALDGRLADPRVGRDLLVGSLAGVALACGIRLVVFVLWISVAVPPTPSSNGIDWIESPRIAVAGLLGRVANALFVALMATLLLVVVKRFCAAVLRMSPASGGVAALVTLGVLVSAMAGLESGLNPASALIAIASALIVVGVLHRLGTLALAVTYFVFTSMPRIPFTLDLGAWHAASMFCMLAVLLAPAIAGFIIVLRSPSQGPGSRVPV